MFERGVAIIYVSRRAAETALKIRETLLRIGVKCQVYAPGRNVVEGFFAIEKRLTDFVEEIIERVDAIVAVMAVGIIIRVIAPLLKNKLKDPAVVCVDAGGRFSISLISGHYGGANKLAQIIADGIGAIPVITTASEIFGRKSVEEVARSLQCKIVNPESLTAVNSLIVDGANVAIIFLGEFRDLPRKLLGYRVKAVSNFERLEKLLKSLDGAIIVTRDHIASKAFSKPASILMLKTIAVGLGSRRNVDADAVLKAIKYALRLVRIPSALVTRLATIDIKSGSSGIIEASKRLGLELLFFSPRELGGLSHEDLSQDSDTVKRHIGIGGVCERAALLAIGGDARLILRKTRVNGVTVAIAVEK